MIKAHKIRLNPTPAQAAHFRKSSGTARFVFNWALSRWLERRATGESVSVLALNHWTHIPKLGRVNMTEQLRFAGKIMSAVVSYRAGWWWVSITVDIPHVPPVHQGQAIGIDLGIRQLATCSDGRVFENQKHLKAAVRKVKHLQRKLARTALGSHNGSQSRLKQEFQE